MRGARVALLAGALAAAGGAGCAAAPDGSAAATPVAPAPPPAPRDDDLVALVPREMETVVEVDLRRVAAWPALPRLLELVPPEAREAFDALPRRLGFDPLRDADLLVVGAIPVEDPAAPAEGPVEVRFVAALRGRFDAERLLARAGGEAAAAGRPTVATHRGVRVVGGGEAAVAALTARTLLVGDPVWVRAAIDCAFGERPSARDAARLMAGWARARGGRPGAAILYAAAPTAGTARRLAPLLEGHTPRGGWGRVELDGGLAAIAGLDVGPSASALAASLGEAAAAAAGHPAVQLLGVATYVRALELTTDGDEVRAVYRLDGRQVGELLALGGRLVALLRPR